MVGKPLSHLFFELDVRATEVNYKFEIILIIIFWSMSGLNLFMTMMHTPRVTHNAMVCCVFHLNGHNEIRFHLIGGGGVNFPPRIV